eukprot:TRINITY_DN32298_c0_g1_i1.p1 TRINITY_DN32298_c0_g1~~TRINITY_DN32298_c0_g1_i1.p1  ORF type:complete len:165 (+),score=22.80 TRINITY_DN32298_c0_g1_i1:75-569(+)
MSSNQDFEWNIDHLIPVPPISPPFEQRVLQPKESNADASTSSRLNGGAESYNDERVLSQLRRIYLSSVLFYMIQIATVAVCESKWGDIAKNQQPLTILVAIVLFIAPSLIYYFIFASHEYSLKIWDTWLTYLLLLVVFVSQAGLYLTAAALYNAQVIYLSLIHI